MGRPRSTHWSKTRPWYLGKRVQRPLKPGGRAADVLELLEPEMSDADLSVDHVDQSVRRLTAHGDGDSLRGSTSGGVGRHVIIGSGRGLNMAGWHRVLLVLAFWGGFSGAARAQAMTILTEINPPTQVQLPDGRVGGPAVEVVRELQRRVGNGDPIELVPWARGYRMLETQPNTALFVMARTAQRDPLFHWIGPFTEAVFALYVKSDSTLTLRSLDDAKMLRAIGVYRDDARDQLLTQAGFTNLDRSVENIANVRKLMLGRIEAIASSDTAIGELLERGGYPRNSVREALVLKRIQTWLALSKETPESTVRAWTEAFDSMRADRSFERLMSAGIPGWKAPEKPITQF